MLNSKQRAFLRGQANTIDTILYVGKSGVIDTVIAQAEDALRVREIIKGKALEAAPVSSREAAEMIAEKTGSEVVQVIGRCFVLYKRNGENPVVSDKLPKSKKK
ncbi:MAG: YhbY family RNA-binding protein [Clostridia bacterium]|nr:YhbY family RNA-binding protein [Clostridia bacterium]